VKRVATEEAIDASSKLRPRRRWLLYVAVTLIGILGLAAIVGESYESLTRAQEERRFQRWGELVDVGGYRLNLNCLGQGSPTVVLDSGFGMPGAEWSLVQPDVAEFTRVCSYDRAGYGWSDQGPLPRSALQNSKELHVLLQNAGVAPPFLMVGHSLGGLNVRVYAHEYPAEVVGVVLVDASQESEFERLPAEFGQFDKHQSRVLHRWQPFMPLLSHLGVTRLLLSDQPPHRGVPASIGEELRFLQLRSNAFDAMAGETDAMAETLSQVRASGTLGDRPLIVLTGGNAGEDLPPELDRTTFRKIWVEELQRSLVLLSSHAKQVVVPDAGPLMPLQQPETVVSGIQEVMRQVREKKQP
jgi:pimeloyl-ACP methyl ester carboxylesterase